MQLETKQAYLLLGSNLGNRQSYLEQAIRLIGERGGMVNLRSSVYETAAWGKTDQPGFLNIAIGVQTKLPAKKLLETVLEIEKSLGRIRQEKWGARLIDIDIILYDDEIIAEEQLQIPHPEMQNRRFVMQPLAEIAPGVMHPVLNKSMEMLLAETRDELQVVKV